ncbi:FGGY-family carbohydrate kinase [Lichenihabitans psoromatis]|uniref:FGGY-family carbohydrate kinase n=1 Tax=Lichenihabitans psoromatis TaxID=2528642 RepID=UPI0010385C81|nr:FGGY family carbohydrate kinase [Lichenihabitans psoromatis]
MAAPLVLGIDQGTSSTKCLLVDGSGTIVSLGQAALAETHPQPGWVEQDAEAVWASVQEAVQACVSPDQAGDIVAAGLSTQRESVVAWDRATGEPLSKVLSWQDRRTVALAASIGTPAVLDRVRAISGLPLDPMFSALKARWILDSIDPDRTRAKAGAICIGTIDSWLMSRFGGEALVEAGNASRTQLLDVDRGTWSDELLAIFDIPIAALPRVVPSNGPFPALRRLAPLPDGVPLAAVMADSHAALFAHGAKRPGDVKATQGTGSSVMGLVTSGATLDPGVCKTIAWSLDGIVHAAEGNIRAAGATLRWVAGLLNLSVDDLMALAEGADSQGVSLVPGFNGLGAPWWDDQAVGLLTNFTLGTSRAAVARAALDSIAHQIADVIDAIHRGSTPLGRLFVDGGPTRNDDLLQAEADLIGRPILRGSTAELSALGVIQLAGLEIGLWTEAQLADRQPRLDMFEPRLSEATRRGARERWRRAVERSRFRDPMPDAA